MQSLNSRTFPFVRTLLASALGVALFMAPTVHASEKPSAEFCAAVREAKDWPLKKIDNMDSRVGFLNSGEKRNGIVGDCWWHSRLQRNSIYLADFAPSEPKPNEKEVIHLMRKILRGHGIVKIPGYANFHEFTAANSAVLMEELIHFRNRSLLWKFEWTRKVFRPLHLNDDRMVEEMAKTKEILAAGDIPYWMLQVDNMGAHSWLILDMTPSSPDAVEQVGSISAIDTVDSNYKKTKAWRYSRRDGKFEGNENFFGIFYVPFNDRVNELHRIRRIAEKACGVKKISDSQHAPAVEAEAQEASAAPAGIEDELLKLVDEE